MSDLLKRHSNYEDIVKLFERAKQGTWQLDPVAMRSALRERVRGQDHVIDDLVPLLSGQYAKLYRRRPVANLLFIGPTGVGKTELCGALAEHLFGDKNAAISYDCGELKSSAALTRLIGSPQGYHGGPGELTTKILTNKRRIIVFDEIEKAHSDVCDLFLAMMGEGRLTDQRSGKTVDLTESIIVLASNAQHDELVKLQQQIRDLNELNNAIRVQLRETGVFRPEIIGRITRIYVFNPLEGIVKAEIALLKMRKIAQEFGMEVQFVSPQLLWEMVEQGDKVKDFGARQREQVIEDLLAQPLLAARQAGASTVQLGLGEAGELVIEPATALASA